MTYWGRTLNRQLNKMPLISLGDGENTFYNPLNIKPSEASYSRNTSSREYPSLSVREGRSKSFGTGTSAVTTPNGLGQRNDTYPHILDGTTWKAWNGSSWSNVQTGLQNLRCRFLEFNTEAKRYTILTYNGTTTNYAQAYDGTTVTSLTTAPQTRLMAMDDYRLYALKDSVLYCSDISDITNWTTGDSDSIPVTSMIGTGTAIVAFNDQIICWSNQSMHILYGNDTADFQWNTNPISAGCISDRAVVIDNGTLYFLDFGKFNAYTGGYPEEISQKVKLYLEGIPYAYRELCCAEKDGRYIYLSIPYGNVTTNNITLEYDTSRGTWYVHNFGILDFTRIGETLYGIDASGVIWKMNDISSATDGGTAISWSHITGAWMEQELRAKKVVSNIYMLVDLPVGSTLDVSYSTSIDNNDFVSLYTATADADEQNVRIQIPTDALQNIDYYRLKFSGTGPCTIHYVDVYLRVKAR